MTMVMTRTPTLEAAPWRLEQPRPPTRDPQPFDRHPNGRKVRSDALPEHLEYRDTGCELSPSCLRCPLARCRYDEPGGARRVLQDARDQAVQRRRREGVGIDALASEFGLSRRSVFRILARGRAAERSSPVPQRPSRSRAAVVAWSSRGMPPG